MRPRGWRVGGRIGGGVLREGGEIELVMNFHVGSVGVRLKCMPEVVRLESIGRQADPVET